MPGLAFAFSQGPLTHDNVPLGRPHRPRSPPRPRPPRLVRGLALAGHRLLAVEARTPSDPARTERVWRLLGRGAIAAAVVAVLLLAVSSRGLTGTISHQVDSVHAGQGRPGDQPLAPAFDQLGQPLGLVEGGGRGLLRPADRRLGRRLVPRDPSPLPPTAGAQRPPAPQRARSSSSPRRASSARCSPSAHWASCSKRRSSGSAGRPPAASGPWPEPASPRPRPGSSTAWSTGTGTSPGPPSPPSSSSRWPSPRPPDRPAAARAAFSPTQALVALAAVTLALAAFAASAILPDLSQSKAQQALAQAGSATTPAQLAKAQATAELAARLNPLATEPLLDAAVIADRRGLRLAERDYLLRAVRRAPYQALPWDRLAYVAVTLGDRTGLLSAVHQALAVDPIGTQSLVLAATAEPYLAVPQNSATATGTPLPH